MKIKLLFFVFFSFLVKTVFSQTTAIPDANFEQALIDLGYDTNGLNGNILNSDAESVYSLSVSNKNISNLTGIEAFKNLQVFSCSNNNISGSLVFNNHSLLYSIHCVNNNITSLGVSNLPNLETLQCDNNALTNLNITNNSDLYNLSCIGNQLTALNVTNNPELIYLFCTNNQISTLNLINNTKLESLRCVNNNLATLNLPNTSTLEKIWCYDNQITSLNIPDTTSLTELLCYNNQITSLQIANSTLLTDIDCKNNMLTSIDISGNTALETLDCSNNNLLVLDASTNVSLTSINCSNNNLQVLNVKNGNNTSINVASFSSINNDDLSCIEVDDASYSNLNWTMVDSHSNFSNYCGFDLTRIPDQNFEQYLVNKGYDTNGLDGYILNSDAELVTEIDVTNLSIITLAGIQAFKNLSKLLCDQNNITFLDLTQNNNLTILKCQDNNLTSLNIKNGNNGIITTFESYNNPNLLCIQVDNAAYSSSNWTNIDSNSSFNEDCVYKQVFVPDNNFEKALIDFGYDFGFLDDYVLENTIKTVKILNVSSKNINSLKGIEGFEGLEELNCTLNNLTDVNLSNNAQLKTLNCKFNSLSSLNLSNNANLETLDCSENNIQNLDLSNNPSLTSIDCSINDLSSLNVKNGQNPNITFFNAVFNSNLTCVDVDNASYSTTNWTNVDSQTNFSVNCSLSIQDALHQKFSFYPNPILDYLNIKTTSQSSLYLYNIKGQLITEVKLKVGENKMLLQNLNAGIYIVKVKSDAGIIHKKIIKN